MNKQDFPFFNENPNLIYLDSATTSQKPKCVIDKIVNFYTRYNCGVTRSSFELAVRTSEKFEQAREKIANFFGCNSSKELFFCSGATDGLNQIALMALQKLMVQKQKKGKNFKAQIVVSELEHHSNYLPWQNLAKLLEIDFTVVPVNKETGNLCVEEFLTECSGVIQIVAITGASNVTGQIIDYNNIAKKLKTKFGSLIEQNFEQGVMVVADLAQLAPHKKIDFKDSSIDFACISAHKMYGPTGIGVVLQKNPFAFEPVKFGGGMVLEVYKDRSVFADPPEKFEAGTQALAQVFGFAKACEYIEKNSTDISDLTNYLIKGIISIEGIKIIGNLNEKRVPLVSWSFNGVHSHDVAQFLDAKTIAVRAGHHCAKPLHNALKIPATTRASLLCYNTKDDVDVLLEALRNVKKYFIK